MNWIFHISVLLNATLVVAAGLAVRRTSSTPAAPASKTPASSSAVTQTTVAPEMPAEISNLTITVTNAFRWELLESTNYATFVANLRAVGCPERTIRDLIFADAERRDADLEISETENLPFWLAGRARVEANRRAETNRAAAKTELQAELRRLFGVVWNPEEHELHDVEFQAVSRMVVGPVSDDQYEKACRWLMDTVEQGRSFRQQRDGLLLGSDLTEWDKIVAAQKASLEQIVGPAAYEELQARTCFLEEVLDEKFLQLKYLELTPAEMRRVCLVKNRECGWLESVFREERQQFDEARETRKIALLSALKTELSPEHFTELLRVQDETYRQLLDVMGDYKLPRTTARQVYEVQQLARTEYQRLRAEPENETAAAECAALQLTTTASLRKILGAETYPKFIARETWATNFSKL